MGIAQMQDTFQSTPLMRGATAGRGDQKPDEQISTRSPHARGDPRPLPASEDDYNFNPLPSHEGRLWASTLTRRCGNFNPLPSCEGRLVRGKARRTPDEFQSASLMRGETGHEGQRVVVQQISIHSSHTRGDMIWAQQIMLGKFQSTPLTRGETLRKRNTPLLSAHFNPLPSCEGRP